MREKIKKHFFKFDFQYLLVMQGLIAVFFVVSYFDQLSVKRLFMYFVLIFFIFFVPLIGSWRLYGDEMALRYIKPSYFWFLFGLYPTFKLGNWVLISFSSGISVEIFFSLFVYFFIFLIFHVSFFVRLIKIKRGEFCIVKYNGDGSTSIEERIKYF